MTLRLTFFLLPNGGDLMNYFIGSPYLSHHLPQDFVIKKYPALLYIICMINTDMAQIKEAAPFYRLSEKHHAVFAQLMFNTS